ncbi:hypothetical protein OR1_03011 [Geobacter sp. OR-1]|uniref:PssD/Cps14F family polysaccharide biosynthesis glycosyltransferase n=1 Tax=Geobacter sp. OR-1 TaxID=1266765 RepID=UPI0005437F2A|nr:PssD/Cps14F family polysaccharide biosynthesis glycosyltransferase [Geobacter sp. OR-1]GAM10718.1 hypothetical protein OR1_03011 [Geobacter sp. OR-1]
MFNKHNELCVVCSAGGHLTEALMAIENIQTPAFVVTYRLPHLVNNPSGYETHFIINPHKNPFKYLVNFIQAFRIYIMKRPKFILSTGSGMTIGMCVIGKLFGSKIIYIETGARIYNPSLTGKFMYYVSDLFIVQWEPLLKHFPRARYGGLLI